MTVLSEYEQVDCSCGHMKRVARNGQENRKEKLKKNCPKCKYRGTKKRIKMSQ
jgi:hypothetical protein